MFPIIAHYEANSITLQNLLCFACEILLFEGE